ncbi:hypothetical protein H2198_003015 [Neophaeococcomyces mojaviensis]|uniref:Uncharacterized protein n=1 Tax=Neophaeococcomyces mojaviensis TaxID=3383035 RepID=A0ACC3ACX8_9EURO|nr:hypothetical protein H2198_003015 [Knufia sp. JES_112]
MSGLSAFSSEVHRWYPILPANYSDQFQHQISGDLAPSSKTCLALLICAIGSVFTTEVASETSFMAMAMESLSSVMFESSIESTQSLIMLSVYNNCRYRPCQAHEFAMAASYKVQSLLRTGGNEESEDQTELVRRAYWAILLIENELNVQFELPKSGLWALNEQVPLPAMRTPWRFSISTLRSTFTSPLEISSQNLAHPTVSSSDRINCYFLAAIAMRRMLHRCTTAIRPTGFRDGRTDYTFAPIIARELEAQLDEWYAYLPQAVRFDKDDNLTTTPDDFVYQSDEPLLEFLHVQYDCCRASIYWPAVWDAIKSEHIGPELFLYCQKFFRSYMYIIPNISSLISKCRVNAWTMYATVFILTLAVAESMKSSCLRAALPNNIVDIVLSAPQVFEPVKDDNPSLALLQDLLSHRIQALMSSMSPVTDVYACPSEHASSQH